MNNLLNRRRSLMGQGGDDNYIHFADPEVERICLANWDTNHNGKISYVEALAVKLLDTQFKNNKTIQDIEALMYFGFTAINNEAFFGCSNLSSKVELPYVINVGDRTFEGIPITEFIAPEVKSIPSGESWNRGGGYLLAVHTYPKYI